MKKIISIITAFLLFAVTLTSCAQTDSPANVKSNDKLSVVTTIFAPYDFAREVAGDKADIAMLLPPASESHSYEPSPQDIIKIQNCDVFIYVGGDSDTWVDGILESMDTSSMKIITLMDCVETVKEEIIEGMEDDHGHEHGHDHAEIIPENVKDRPMSDFNGSWVSAIPLINDGSLDEYIKHTAEESEVTPEDQKKALLEKWASDYNNITVSGSNLSAQGTEGEYEYKGYTLVEKDSGEYVVWYQYQALTSTDLPEYIAFNDHGDGNTENDEEIPHMHMRYGNDGFEALLDAKSTPYYFDAGYSGAEIGEFMTGHSHEEHAEYDEHVWTSPKNAKLIVQKISEAICETDSDNADVYAKNTSDYLQKLDELDAAFIDAVNNAVRKTIIFGDRFPFRYFTDAYGLDYFAAFPGCSTETEPSAKTIAFLIDKINEEKIPAIFHIELSNRKMADAISESTGAKVLELHSCHNITRDDFNKGVTYLDLMNRNVAALKEALQ